MYSINEVITMTDETEYFNQCFNKKTLDSIREVALKEKRSVTQQINIFVEISLLNYKKGVRL